MKMLIENDINVKIRTNVNDYKLRNFVKNIISKLLNISHYKSFNFIDELKFYRDILYISKVNLTGNNYGIDQYEILNESLIVINAHINNVILCC